LATSLLVRQAVGTAASLEIKESVAQEGMPQ
jgi:hypothetical protein